MDGQTDRQTELSRCKHRIDVIIMRKKAERPSNQHFSRTNNPSSSSTTFRRLFSLLRSSARMEDAGGTQENEKKNRGRHGQLNWPNMHRGSMGCPESLHLSGDGCYSEMIDARPILDSDIWSDFISASLRAIMARRRRAFACVRELKMSCVGCWFSGFLPDEQPRQTGERKRVRDVGEHLCGLSGRVP